MDSVADLPPMPDRHTGEPRPPSAPVIKLSNEKAQPWHGRKVPQPPEGYGPPLEWSYGDPRTQLWVFGIVAVLLMAFMTGKDLLDSTPGITWVSTWQLWLVVIVGGGLMSLIARGMRVSAGADWLMDRKEIVHTYQLISIKVDKDWSDGTLDLADRWGNGVRTGLGELAVNPALWDLVYNGIRHSAANGASVDRMAIEHLRLHDVVALSERHEKLQE